MRGCDQEARHHLRVEQFQVPHGYPHSRLGDDWEREGEEGGSGRGERREEGREEERVSLNDMAHGQDFKNSSPTSTKNRTELSNTVLFIHNLLHVFSTPIIITSLLPIILKYIFLFRQQPTMANFNLTKVFQHWTINTCVNSKMTM